MEPVPILAVGDLKSELSRWTDDTSVTFYSPLREQEFRFIATGRALVLVRWSLRLTNFQKHRRRRYLDPSGWNDRVRPLRGT